MDESSSKSLSSAIVCFCLSSLWATSELSWVSPLLWKVEKSSQLAIRKSSRPEKKKCFTKCLFLFNSFEHFYSYDWRQFPPIFNSAQKNYGGKWTKSFGFHSALRLGLRAWFLQLRLQQNCVKNIWWKGVGKKKIGVHKCYSQRALQQ